MTTKLYENRFNIAIEENKKVKIIKVDGWTFEIFDKIFGLHHFNQNWRVTDMDTGHGLCENRDKITVILTTINRVLGKEGFNPLYIEAKRKIIEELRGMDIEVPVNK
jgi:hypothetical protein